MGVALGEPIECHFSDFGVIVFGSKSTVIFGFRSWPSGSRCSVILDVSGPERWPPGWSEVGPRGANAGVQRPREQTKHNLDSSDRSVLHLPGDRVTSQHRRPLFTDDI